MSQIDTDHFRARLLEERERVVRTIERLHEDNPGSLEDETGELVSGSADNHMGDMATATFDREMDQTLEQNEERVLNAIDAALQRIEDGTYGIGAACGKPIETERLE